MLFPTDDYTVALVARHHQALANHYRLTVPPWEEVQWACDKRLLHRLGARLGIPQPWTVCPSSREELKEIECPFPVILKLAVRTQPPSLAIPKAWRAEDRNALLASYDEAGRMVPAEDLIVQEIVPGGGEAQFSYAAICKQGRSLASLVARRTRQFPKDFGQFSTYVETVDEPSVIRPAEQLLAAMDYTGIVEIEFKRDPRNGEFKLFDINPRVWGWQSLSARAGVDFPFLLWLMVNGKGLPPACATAGKRWLHLTADLRVAVGEILRGHLSLWSYLRTFRGPRESAIFAWDDPLPGLLDLPLFAYSLGKRSLGTKNAQVGSL
jgi:predicted ATP-grasp superfamily ATP-dependent carboligase